MSLAVATLPDDPAHLARWLDEQLVGDRLGDLVDELTAVHGAAGASGAATGSVTDSLGDLLPAVLRGGLGVVPIDRLRQLLRRPHHLLELQELVFTDGGDYWRRLHRPRELTRRAEDSWAAIADKLPTAPPVVPLSVAKPQSQGWLRYAAVSFATAAAVLLAVGLFDRLRQPNTPTAAAGWGWAKAGGLPKNPDAKGYLSALADAAEEWRNKRPDDAAGLAKRITEFRQGCSTLLLADHPPLSDGQRADLKDHCRKWAGKLDDALAKLESGEKPEAVRAGVDDTVDKLVQYLRGEAAKG